MVGDGHDELHVVLDQHHHDAGRRDLAQQLAEPARIAGVEPRRRLVEHQHAGRDRERAGDLDQALVDMRQRAGEAIERTGVADEGEQAFGQRRPLRVAVGRQQLARPPRRPRRSATSTLSITLIWPNSCVVW